MFKNNGITLECGHLVSRMGEKRQEKVRKDLAELLNFSTYGKSDGPISVDKKNYFAIIKECFCEDGCNNRIFLGGVHYCYNQRELRPIYEEDHS